MAKYTITPRGLKAALVNKLIKLQGIVVSTTKVRPRLVESTHFNEKHNTFHIYNYPDSMGLKSIASNNENIEYARD